MCQLHLNTWKMGQQRVQAGILGQGTPKRQRPTHQVCVVFNKTVYVTVKVTY